MNIRIKDIPTDDRPRERLLNLGPESLSNEELIAILLNSGFKDLSARNLSALLLNKAGGIDGLKNMNYQKLINIKGIGEVKACIILAFTELSQRMNYKTPKILGIKFTSPEIVFDYYKDKLDHSKEQVFCLYLNSSHKVIKEKLLFVGTVNRSIIHPRDIFKIAYEVNASAIICMHNHPSDNTQPSIEDENITCRLRQISLLMGIEFLDHIIVGRNNYYSFMENGKI